MQSMKFIGQVMFMFLIAVLSAQAVPPVLNYAGQVAVNGQPFEGEGLFKFALVNANGDITYWSNDGTSVNGSEPQASVKAPVSGGLYSLLLGNTAIPGMGAINPQVFAQHSDAKLRVWFSDGVNGFQQLSPDRPFASVPYAFSAGTATIADGSINKSMLGSDVLSDLNAPIGLNRLSSEVTAKLDQNGSVGSGVVAGSLISIPSGQSAPAGYSMYQRGTPKELVWEEKAPVSVARYAYDGVVFLDGQIYFVGGFNGSAKNTAERYDPTNNTWETIASLSLERWGVASAVLNGNLYAIGGKNSSSISSSVETYRITSNGWVNGPSLPTPVRHSTAITVNEKIYLIGGINASGQNINQVLCFDPSTNQWSAKANMPTARHAKKLVWFENRIWPIGGYTSTSSNKVESYDPTTNSWQAEASLTTARQYPVAWVANGRIYVGGGKKDSSSYLNSIEVYDPTIKQWSNAGSFPENKYNSDAVVLNDIVYVVAGHNGSVYSNKVYAADLNASLAGVFDLYRKDGNASAGTPLVQAEVADGSVTASKIASKTIGKDQISDNILKYLKPEITAQPQAQIVYADSNASFSVSAEGKYLAYQWKKDGVDLTGETNATINIVDANAPQHDGNYSVVVSNDFGSVESGVKTFTVLNSEMDGLVGWWKFDETNGTIAYDSSGNGNDGNLTNGPTWVSGKIGGALSFDGIDEYVDLGSSAILNPSEAIAITCWFLPNEISDYAYGIPIVTRYIAGTDFSRKSYFLKYSSLGKPEYYLYNGSSKVAFISSSLVLTKNQFYFIAVTYSNTGGDMYINDAKVAELELGDLTSVMQSSVSTRIGGWGHNDWPEFNGLIDDVRIYDRALSAAEVQALYNLGQ
jgi:N-acetylneuraminic acid mutarotase